MKVLDKMKRSVRGKDNEKLGKMPPYFQTIVAYQDRIRAYKTGLFIVSAVFIINVISTELRLSQKDLQLSTREISVISDGNVHTFKPGTVSDQVVRQAFDRVIIYLNNVTFDTVEETYSYLERFMSQELRVKFRKYWRGELPKWKRDKYEQTMHLTPTSQFYRSGNKYYTLIKFKISRYMHDRALNDETRFLKIEITKRDFIKPDSASWFDLTDYKWLKESEYLNEKENFDRIVVAN